MIVEVNKNFINETFTKAINAYLNESNKGIIYNSFLVVCIRLLIIIYSQTDIINPFNIGNEEVLKNNLIKFGYPMDEVNKFLNNFTEYSKIEQQNEKTLNKYNPYFITIQKQLIDMLIAKKVNFHLVNEEIKEFYDLLYTPDSLDPLKISYNYMVSGDIYAIKNYFLEQLKKNVKPEEESIKNYLNNRSYEIMGYSMEYIKTLTVEQLEKMNHSVYDYFKIRENAINKEYLLEKAIEEFDNTKKPLTSGNGYVDILLIMGIITTIIMVGAIVKYLVF